MISKQKVRRKEDGVIGVLSPRYVINEKRNDGFVFIADYEELNDYKKPVVYTFDEIKDYFETAYKKSNLLTEEPIDMRPTNG